MIVMEKRGLSKDKIPIMAVCALLLIIAGVFLTLAIMRNNRLKYIEGILEIRRLIEGEKTIIHAAGGVYGTNGEYYTYTNSAEAMQSSIDAGNRFIEIDFVKTPDKGIICSGDDKYIGVDEQDFMSEYIDGGFTPMSIDTVAEFMYKYPDIYIITDVKNGNYWGCYSIYKRYPDLADRFIVQVYHDSEYEDIRKLGFKYIIFTLYATEEPERKIDALSANVKDHDYVGITFWEEWMQNAEFYEGLSGLDIPLYVHTVNDPDSIKEDISHGISAVYTDKIDNDWLR